MVVAYITTEKDALQALATGDLDPFLSAAPFLFLFASVVVLIFGPGRISLDHLLAKLFAPEKNTERRPDA
jgi:putative oxidoreductase